MSLGFPDKLAYNPLAFSTIAWREETHFIDTTGSEAQGKLANRAVYAYNNTGVAIPSGGCCLLQISGTEAQCPQVGLIHAASGTGYVNMVVVAESDVGIAGEGWFIYKGWCNALVESTTDITDGDNLGVQIGGGAGTSFSLKKVSALQANAVGKAAATRTTNDEGRIRAVLDGRYLQF